MYGNKLVIVTSPTTGHLLDSFVDNCLQPKGYTINLMYYANNGE